jgi:predicted LPLAT superfamily acyltransferase
MNKTVQRGSGWSIALVFNLYKIFGYKFIYYLMYPVTFFYFLFAPNVKKSLKEYYSNIDKEFNNRVYYEHLRVFAICMVDRFISKLTSEIYTYNIPNEKELTAILNKGCILLQSHYGGWASSINNAKVEKKLNIVMQESMLDSIKKIENQKSSSENINIIDLNQGTIAVSVQIANALMGDEIVAIMGDRSANEKANKSVEFFAKCANFNKNPFQIAYKCNKPILVYFVILDGIKHYKLEYRLINLDKSLKEDEAIDVAIKEYVQLLEYIIKQNPNQWFNFYNFWEN